MIRLGIQDLPIDLLGLFEAAGLVVLQRFFERRHDSGRGVYELVPAARSWDFSRVKKNI